ncbi:hypothetical protein TNCT_515131 [Trichonephila clavata]|uniref:Uncharacterized protein n=1 Tax=Trichonephila clavata TaxID=2740835 RepID=A0A8X6I6E8_TRICU|nr:hypothetical protein TNCT_515131 [Trichonephila clavata]
MEENPQLYRLVKWRLFNDLTTLSFRQRSFSFPFCDKLHDSLTQEKKKLQYLLSAQSLTVMAISLKRGTSIWYLLADSLTDVISRKRWIDYEVV